MNPALVIVVTLVVFVGTLVVASFAWGTLRSREAERARAVARRLGTLSEAEEDSLFRSTARDPLAEALGDYGRSLEARLLQAGQPYPFPGLVTRVVVWALAGVLIAGLVFRSPVAIAGVVLGVVPIVLLGRAAEKRAAALSQQLPDALDLIGRSLQAGHGLSDAMKLCAEEMQPPVSQELGRVFEEHNLGRDLRDALQNLSVRNPTSFDIKIFVSSVLLQRDTGGNLIEILDNISRTIRDRFVFQAKVKALTAEARISAYILGGLPFVLLTIIAAIRPFYLLPLVTDPLGIKLAVGALALFGTGVFVMSRISTVET
jgi:tight adherence protein B